MAISNRLKNIAIAGFLAFAAPAAQAATVVFDTAGGPVPSVSGFNYEVTASAGGILNGGTVAITQTGNGLGVRANPDSNGQLDGFPLLSSERLTVTFGYAVRLVDFTLGLLDSNDDVNVYINNVFYAKLGPNLPASLIALDINNVTSFAIEAVGEVQTCGFLCNIDGLGNDDVRLAGFTTAAVPLPAAGWLMLAGLGGIAALRRRKAA